MSLASQLPSDSLRVSMLTASGRKTDSLKRFSTSRYEQQKRLNTPSIIGDMYQKKQVTILDVSNQVDMRTHGQNRTDIETVIKQIGQDDQLMSVEKLVYVFQLLQQDYKPVEFLLQKMIDCLQENKPQNQILAKDLEEMLIQQQENDPYVSVDQCGLARIIAKQQLTE